MFRQSVGENQFLCWRYLWLFIHLNTSTNPVYIIEISLDSATLPKKYFSPSLGKRTSPVFASWGLNKDKKFKLYWWPLESHTRVFEIYIKPNCTENMKSVSEGEDFILKNFRLNSIPSCWESNSAGSIFN